MYGTTVPSPGLVLHAYLPFNTVLINSPTLNQPSTGTHPDTRASASGENLVTRVKYFRLRWPVRRVHEWAA